MGGVNFKSLQSRAHTISVQWGNSEHYFLESWQHGFHCWTYQHNTKQMRATIFPCSMMDADNVDKLSPNFITVFMMMQGIKVTTTAPLRYELGFQGGNIDTHTLPQALNDFQSYLLGIPYVYRQLASYCPKHHYLALESMREVSGFSDFLAQEHQHGGMAYVLAVWKFANADQLPKMFRLQLAVSMMSETRTTVIESLIDLPCSKPFLRLLKKIPLQDLKTEHLWRLFDLSQELKMRTALLSLAQIQVQALQEWAAVPSWMVSTSLFQVLDSGFQQEKSLNQIFPPSLLQIKEERQAPFKQALTRCKDMAALERTIYTWANKLVYAFLSLKHPLQRIVY